uniref:Serpentine receptor class gamma n=1 Tax=Caenorhabditis japonica TaxID=281687 RepID=A0A8R1EA84_CAEJA
MHTASKGKVCNVRRMVKKALNLLILTATLFANYFGAMFPKFGLFSNVYLYLDGIYAHIYFYLAWSTGICQAMSVSVLATNRLSAMMFPGSYHKMWLSKRLLIAIAIQFLPGMFMGSLTFFNTTELVMNENNGIVPKFVNKSLTNFFFGIGGLFLFVNCLYLIVAYCYLFIRLRNRNHAASQKFFGTVYWSKAKEKAHQRDLRLFTMCSIIVAVQILIFLFFTMKTLALFELTVDEFYVFYNALSDLFASINPYLLWIFSDSLRKHAFGRLGLRKHITSVANESGVSMKAIPSSGIFLAPRET